MSFVQLTHLLHSLPCLVLLGDAPADHLAAFLAEHALCQQWVQHQPHLDLADQRGPQPVHGLVLSMVHARFHA